MTYTFCSSKSVARYGTTSLPAANGGTIADGMYRLAYVLDTKATHVTKDDSQGYAYLFNGGQYVGVGFGEGSVGSFTATSGDNAGISFTPSASCDSAAGTPESTTRKPWTKSYAVDGAGTLYLFDGATAHVLIKVPSLCSGVDAAPDAPGDSYTCHVQNCACAEAANAAADATVCTYVAGG
jgi:hypothetical protein